jgi:hypothetical protein
VKPPTHFELMRANRERPRTPEEQRAHLLELIERLEKQEVATWQEQREHARADQIEELRHAAIEQARAMQPMVLPRRWLRWPWKVA